MGAPELPDVLPELLAELALVRALFHVGSVQALDVRRVEHGRHRRQRREGIGHGLHLRRLQHPGLADRLQGVVGNRVPGAEDQVVQRRQRHEVLDQRLPLVGALAQTDGLHLADRAERLRQPAAHRLHPRDERRRDGAEAR